MRGAHTVLNEVRAADTILEIKRRIRSLNPKLFMRRQRLVYMSGPNGMEPLADDATLGCAGVTQDGSAVLDLLLVDETPAETRELGHAVCGVS